MGTHTLHFAKNNDGMSVLESNLVVQKLISPTSVKKKAKMKVGGDSAGVGGRMRQSFRPFAWSWGPNEERPMWTTLFDCVNALCVAVGGYSGDVKDIFSVAIIDHKESTKLAIKDTYNGIRVCQCFTHVLRNARSKKGRFAGAKDEKKKQVDWFVRQVSLIENNWFNFNYLD